MMDKSHSSQIYTSELTRGSDLRSVGVTWRAIWIGLLLMPVNVYWVIQIEGVWYSGMITLISLFMNTTISLLVIILINLCLRRISPRSTLSQGELLTIFIMLNLGVSIASHDFIQVLFAGISHIFWFATPENEWHQLFTYIPQWLTVDDKPVLNGFYNADSTLYTTRNLLAWMRPFVWWSAFICALLLMMLCINILVKKQWTQREKLVYPIIQLPLTITKDGGSVSLFKNGVLWVGFGIAATVDIVNSLNFFFPTMPHLSIKFNDIGPLFTSKPWSAIGWMPFTFYPFIIGLSFFLPLDLSFSIWFFYLFRKVQRVLTATFGLQSIPNFPYLNEQSSGAWIGFAVVLIWVTRKHLKEVVLNVFNDKAARDESQESSSYRWGIMGILCCGAFLLFFSYRAGMSISIIILFFALYFAFATAIARMRAELGPPFHELTYVTPQNILTDVMGTRPLGAGNLTMFSMFWWFNRSWRSHPMPHQLEGFKMAEQTGMQTKRIALAMILAIFAGTIVSFWIMLDGCYRRLNLPLKWFGGVIYSQLDARMSNPTGSNFAAIGGMGVGFTLTLFLMFLRRQFIWWPLHPAGYALSTNLIGTDYIWFCLVLSSSVKLALIRYGGLRLYRKAIPFFIGLVLGEYVVVTVLNGISIIFKTQTYVFWIYQFW